MNILENYRLVESKTGDDGCHNQRHKKLKERFQHFKKRCQNRLLFIPLQVNKKFFHDGSPLFRNRSGFRISLTL